MDISMVLTKKYPDNEWVLNGNDYNNLVWLSDSQKPSEEELSSYWDEVQSMVQAEQDAKAAAKESALTKLQALGLS
jgi:hypothetical protein